MFPWFAKSIRLSNLFLKGFPDFAQTKIKIAFCSPHFVAQNSFHGPIDNAKISLATN